MKTAVEAYQQGGIIAYPTEAVFGLGCDPDNSSAIEKLLALKNRPQEKGLILLAADYSQLLPYLDDSSLSKEALALLLAKWPDGITQVFPKNKNTSAWLTGKFDSIAVRVTSQPDVVRLCNQVNKPIVSTSANLSGDEPARKWQDIPTALAEKIDFIIQGNTLGFSQPSTIINALTGETYR